MPGSDYNTPPPPPPPSQTSPDLNKSGAPNQVREKLFGGPGPLNPKPYALNPGPALFRSWVVINPFSSDFALIRHPFYYSVRAQKRSNTTPFGNPKLTLCQLEISVESSKGVVQHVSLKNQSNGSIMTRKRLIKNHLHDQRTDFGDLLEGKTGNDRRITELFHDNSSNRISSLRDSQQGFGSNEVSKDVAAFLDNGLVESSPREGRQRNRDPQVNGVFLNYHSLSISSRHQGADGQIESRQFWA